MGFVAEGQKGVDRVRAMAKEEMEELGGCLRTIGLPGGGGGRGGGEGGMSTTGAVMFILFEVTPSVE